MKSLVTGGGGFLGKYVVQKLLARGDDVTVLGRHVYLDLKKLGADSIAVDIRDHERVVNAIRGIDEVFHIAAIAKLWGDWQEFYDINVKGTENILHACKTNHVSKLIYTSSPSVIFDGKAQRHINEDHPYPSHWLAHYPHTKMLAEQKVLHANENGKFHTVSLRPHLIWGPGDAHLIPRVIARAKSNKLIQVGDGSNIVDITHVSNAADAHLQAAEQMGRNHQCNGKAYFISQDEPVRLWDFIQDILNRAQVGPVRKSISFRSAYKVGAALEWVYRRLNKKSEPQMTRFLACQLAQDHFYDISRAKNDFGYRAKVSTLEGLENLFG